MKVPSDELIWLAWTQLWQVTAVVVAVGLVARYACRRRPHLAHLLWMLVIVKCLTPPLLSSPTGVFSWLQLRVIALARQPPAPPPPGAALIGPRPQPEEEPIAGGGQPSRLPPVLRGEPPGRPIPLGPALLAVWASGVVALGGLTWFRWFDCRRLLRKTAVDVPDEVAAMVSELSGRLGLRRKVRVVVSSSSSGPAAFGIFRPTVLLPEAAVEGRRPEDLAPIVAHELMHVRRGDTLLSALQIAAQLLWWFHPSVWWAVRQSCRAGERCCDQQTMAELGCRPADYVRSLLEILRVQRTAGPALAFPGGHGVEVTSNRLEDIMSYTGRLCRRTPRWCWAAALIAAFVVLPGRELVIRQAKAEVGDLLLTIPSPAPEEGERFGNAVAAVGNNVLVGAVQNDMGAEDAGVAYLLDPSTGQLLQTYLNPTPDAGDWFGHVVAAVGDNVLIGASHDDVGGVDAGAAYLFDGSTGELLRTFLNPSPTASHDDFGHGIAAFGDDVLIAAARTDRGGVENVGAVYLFDGATGQLLQTFENPTPEEDDYFGAGPRAIAAVGTNVLIGANQDDTAGENAGAAYLFDPTTGEVLHTFLDPTPHENDRFGAIVAVIGENILIGEFNNAWEGVTNVGAVHLFDGSSLELLRTFLHPQPTPTDHFGRSIAVMGTNVLVAARQDDTGAENAGAAYLFDSDTGELLHTFLNPTPEQDDIFGTALTFVGNNVLIGALRDDTMAQDAGTLYLFEGPPVIPEPSTLTLLLGGGVCLLIHVRRLRRRRP